MNRQMKRWLSSAIFVGFTGTPLLRKDKPMTRDVFGTYIHTDRFHEGVADGVILDLKYEARDVPQRLTSQTAFDNWFEHKTRNLNNFHRILTVTLRSSLALRRSHHSHRTASAGGAFRKLCFNSSWLEPPTGYVSH